ncbi:uncharacterized protein LTR77_001154 [Saxophila tyrrhenica]|uniref:Uncharacterized protein n=1 Tax=Saxophila tyrrhenica TaxID=1690608 RepID=A0AAV9PKN1_9PEZI|nr:hypothetical protein LTR77_001154 [Saxophila tyrrhenica]
MALHDLYELRVNGLSIAFYLITTISLYYSDMYRNKGKTSYSFYFGSIFFLYIYCTQLASAAIICFGISALKIKPVVQESPCGTLSLKNDFCATCGSLTRFLAFVGQEGEWRWDKVEGKWAEQGVLLGVLIVLTLLLWVSLTKGIAYDRARANGLAVGECKDTSDAQDTLEAA